jgi:hypothetical protein
LKVYILCYVLEQFNISVVFNLNSIELWCVEDICFMFVRFQYLSPLEVML